MNEVLGGSFTRRINMNLREDKHWSYGAFTFFRDARGPAAVRGVCAGADRQDEGGGDRGAEGAARDPHGPAAHRGGALPRRLRLTLTLPGNWETMGAVSGSIRTS